MFKSIRQGELYKNLATRLCCAADSPTVDYFLCQHCRNYAEIMDIVTIHVPGWAEVIPARWVNPDQLHKAFLGLSPDQKMVIYLKVNNGLSNHEVAETLSKSIGAVKVIYNRGLRTLLHLLFSGHQYMEA